MFMVGVAAAYSYASRQARGQSYVWMAWHAAVRSVVLVLLGVFLRSDHSTQTNFTFEDVVTQIGLGYFFLFLLCGRSPRVQWAAAALILTGYWLWFRMHPLPPDSFDYASVGVPANWQHLSDAAQHWDKNTNAAAAFDQWFLNLFPREKEFRFNGGGYLTLSFIPSLATMVFGLLAGECLRGSHTPLKKFWTLAGFGLAGLLLAVAIDRAGVCPIVKRIWTPSWALFAAGWTTLTLAGFYLVVDVWGWRRWTFPLIVVGMNSITMYVMAELLPGWLGKTLQVHFGHDVFMPAGEIYEPLIRSAAILAVMWLVCYWLYRQKIFIRV